MDENKDQLHNETEQGYTPPSDTPMTDGYLPTPPVEERQNHENVDDTYRRKEAGFSDGDYLPSSQMPRTPRSYSYTRPEMKENWERWERSEREKAGYANPAPPKLQKENGSGMSVSAIVALCLVCALIGSIMGGLIMSSAGALPSFRFWKDRDKEQTEEIILPTEEGEEALPEDAESAESAESPESAEIVDGVPRLYSHRGDSEKMDSADIYDLACEQVVFIELFQSTKDRIGVPRTNTSTGTGFIVTSDGYIITNYHVIETEGEYSSVKVILHNGDEYPATIVGYEEYDSDIAVLKIDAQGLSPATLGDSSELRTGEVIYPVGHPLGDLQYTITMGIVSAKDRVIKAGTTGKKINMFQMDASVNSGNSGGPVYNAQGKVVGVATAKYSDNFMQMGLEGLSFAIPINEAIALANNIMENTDVRGAASFGITITDVSDVQARYFGITKGAYVQSVGEGSCAEKAGIQPGDVITGIDSYTVESMDELRAAIKHYKAGQDAIVNIFRNGEDLSLPITFDNKLG